MKKTLGLLALTLAVSSVASASQDFLKKVAVDVNAGYTYQDKGLKKDGTPEENTKTLIGNEGFKRVNKTDNVFNKKLSGTVVLHNEGGVELDFAVKQADKTLKMANGNNTAGYEKTFGQELKLRKSVKVGQLNTDWFASYEGSKTRKYDAAKMMTEAGRTTNTYKLGTSFKAYNLVEVNPVVKYMDNGSEKDKWVAELGLNYSKGGDIAKVAAGTVSYNLGFNHTLSYVGTKPEMAKEKRGDLSLEYTQELKYTTPKFYGVMGSIALKNKWEKGSVNAKEPKNAPNWTNEFVIPVELNYAHTFMTKAGDVEVKPYASYELLKRNSEYRKYNKENKRTTTEKNTAKVGLSVTLNVK